MESTEGVMVLSERFNSSKMVFNMGLLVKGEPLNLMAWQEEKMDREVRTSSFIQMEEFLTLAVKTILLSRLEVALEF